MDRAYGAYLISRRARELSIHASLAQATRLRQSILCRGIFGKLVPQDPQEEPATIRVNRLRDRTRVWPEPAPVVAALPAIQESAR